MYKVRRCEAASRLPYLSQCRCTGCFPHWRQTQTGAALAKFRAHRRTRFPRYRIRSRPSRLMSLQSRLAKLPYAQLLEIAVNACESSPELKNKADALIAEVAPLPSWCVDILLSPDLLPQLFSSLRLSEHAAAGVCSTWSGAYSRQLRRCRYIDPRSVRQLAGVPKKPKGLCMLPGGVLAIAASDEHDQTAVKFVAARSDSDPQALAACRSSSLATRRFGWLMGLARANDGLLACSYDDQLYKFALDGSMDELAMVHVLTDFERECKRCAVHQQSQKTYAIIGQDGSHHSLVLLDANLQVVATVEAADFQRDVVADSEDYGPICDIAVHGDQVIVLTSGSHPKGSGLRVLDLDGRFLRTIAAWQFRNPKAVTASHGRAFVIDHDFDYNDDDDDDDDERTGDYIIYIIDIQSGDIIQRAQVNLSGEVTAMIADGDEIFISDFDSSEVVVLRYAGSEA